MNESDVLDVKLVVTVIAESDQFHVDMTVGGQRSEVGSIPINPPGWAESRKRYPADGETSCGEVELGRGLYAWLIQGKLRELWGGHKGPVRMAVELDQRAIEAGFLEIPLCLLQSGEDRFFGQQNSSLAYYVRDEPHRSVALPPFPRVAVVSATPGEMSRIDVGPLVTHLREIFGDSRVLELCGAGLTGLEEQLKDKMVDILHLVAHGKPGVVFLGAPAGGDPGATDADSLARVVKALGIQIVFLTVCRSGVGDPLRGVPSVASRLVRTSGGDCAFVVGCRWDLRQESGEHEFAASFYRELVGRNAPAAALNTALLKLDAASWSVPLLLSRNLEWTRNLRDHGRGAGSAREGSFVSLLDRVRERLSHRLESDSMLAQELTATIGLSRNQDILDAVLNARNVAAVRGAFEARVRGLSRGDSAMDGDPGRLVNDFASIGMVLVHDAFLSAWRLMESDGEGLAFLESCRDFVMIELVRATGERRFPKLLLPGPGGSGNTLGSNAIEVPASEVPEVGPDPEAERSSVAAEITRQAGACFALAPVERTGKRLATRLLQPMYRDAPQANRMLRAEVSARRGQGDRVSILFDAQRMGEVRKRSLDMLARALRDPRSGLGRDLLCAAPMCDEHEVAEQIGQGVWHMLNMIDEATRR